MCIQAHRLNGAKVACSVYPVHECASSTAGSSGGCAVSDRTPNRTVEAICWVVGSMLILAFFGARTYGELERQRAISAFEQTRAVQRADAIPSLHSDAPQYLSLDGGRGLLADLVPDQTQWSEARVQAHVSVAAEPADSRLLPAAVLRIGRVGLEVPVYGDTGERNLNRGAGLIEGTALPGSDGNVAIAAHRDGYFRALKDVHVGDTVELETLSQQRTYRVTELFIVEPTDIWPLHETAVPAITLVTCYPFYFLGNAPQRFIVRAVAVEF
jgi:sortase A